MVAKASPAVRRRGSYGIDAPYWAAIFAAFAIANLVCAAMSGSLWAYMPAVFLLACVGSWFYTTLQGKFVVWGQLLDQSDLHGDERILDLGCGRGAVLLAAAQHLVTGRAIGVDLWRREDQSGNSAEATQRNAHIEGVADRVEVQTADMSDLPFADGSFDLVISSLAIHNIKEPAQRNAAIDEAIRVLRRGGRLMIADLWYSRQYQQRMAQIGMEDVCYRRLNWRFWWGGPWMATYLITATKPLKNN